MSILLNNANILCVEPIHSLTFKLLSMFQPLLTHLQSLWCISLYIHYLSVNKKKCGPIDLMVVAVRRSKFQVPTAGLCCDCDQLSRSPLFLIKTQATLFLSFIFVNKQTKTLQSAEKQLEWKLLDNSNILLQWLRMSLNWQWLSEHCLEGWPWLRIAVLLPLTPAGNILYLYPPT